MKKRRPDPRDLVAGIAFLVVGVVLANRFLERINPDGISYLAVAEHVARGRLSSAVNGYWGPLLSWLVAPLLAAGVAPLVAARAVSLAAGLAALWGLTRTGRIAGLDRTGLLVLQVAAIPALALGSTAFVTPDMLFLAIWLHYVALVHGAGRGARRRDLVLAGLLGGLGYLAKPYGFYIFLLHFGLLASWRCLRAPLGMRPATAGAYAAGLAAFLALALPWMGCLGAKYGGFPVSTSGPYNRALFAPGSPGQPLEHMGFVLPPHEHATSAWEDPTGLPLPDWGRVDRATAIRHQVRLIVDNGRRLVLAATYANYAVLVALPVLVLTLLRSRRAALGAPTAFLPVVMSIYPAGYLLIRVEQRYVWVTTFLGLIVAVVIARRLSATRSIAVAAAISGVVVLGAWHEPYNALRRGDAASSRVRAAAEVVHAAAPQARRLAASGQWPESLAVAWRLGLRFHGVRGDLSPSEAAAALDEQQVDVYLDWSPDGSAAPAGDGWTLVAGSDRNVPPAIYRRVTVDARAP